MSEGTPTTRADFRLAGTQLEAEDQVAVTHRVRHRPEGGALEHQAGAPDDPLTEVGGARSRQERMDFVRGLIQGGRGRNLFLLALLLSQALDVRMLGVHSQRHAPWRCQRLGSVSLAWTKGCATCASGQPVPCIPSRPSTWVMSHL